MPCHLKAKVSLLFFFKKYAIRALLSSSNIDFFARKLLDSENSHMTKQMGY